MTSKGKKSAGERIAAWYICPNMMNSKPGDEWIRRDSKYLAGDIDRAIARAVRAARTTKRKSKGASR